MYQILTAERVQESIDQIIDMKLSTAELKQLMLKWEFEMSWQAATGLDTTARPVLVKAAKQVIQDREVI
tara:strand:- start:78 stop:284 length:207 start_codon:yes stop_codon:yes gene_type:complete